MKPLLVLVALVFMVGCTDANGAREALTQAGYSNVSIDGYGFFACSEDDVYATEFTALGPTGQAVRGVVCAGWLKGKTIRLY